MAKSAGPDQTVFLGVVQLDGTGSFDSDGDTILVWLWNFESLPPGSGATLDSRFSQTPSFQPDLLGDYELSLVVSDQQDFGLPDTVTITVIENQPPVTETTVQPASGAASLSWLSSMVRPVTTRRAEHSNIYGASETDRCLLQMPSRLTPTTPRASTQATLTVVDDYGNIDFDSVTITVNAPPQLIDLGDRTRDEATGLDWLDVTETASLSYDAILAGAGGWLAAGWRHATLQEVCDFFTTHAVAPADPCGSGSEFYGSDASVVPLQALLGITRALPECRRHVRLRRQRDGRNRRGDSLCDVSTAGYGQHRRVSTRNRSSYHPRQRLAKRRPLPRAPILRRPSRRYSPLALYTLVPGLLIGVGLLAMRRRRRSL